MDGHDARAVAGYILRRARELGIALTPMHILKLVYIAHGWNLAITGSSLIRDQVEAWQWGPVIPALYHAVKRFGSSPITGEISAPYEELTHTEQDLLGRVLEAYGRMPAFQLSALTHQPGTPWDVTWKKSGGRRNQVIPNQLIQQHYLEKATA